MANIDMMTDGRRHLVRVSSGGGYATSLLKRRQTYEEVIDYIEHDKDKIQYPDHTALSDETLSRRSTN